MRISLALSLSLLLVAAPASALQKPGDRTIPPDQILQDFAGAGVSDGEMERVAAGAASHPFGSPQNPVRVSGPEGERSYLARLRCADGSTPKAGVRSQAGVGAFGTVVGAYAVDCGSVDPGKTQVVLDMYHDGYAETRAPAGFTLVR